MSCRVDLIHVMQNKRLVLAIMLSSLLQAAPLTLSIFRFSCSLATIDSPRADPRRLPPMFDVCSCVEDGIVVRPLAQKDADGEKEVASCGTVKHPQHANVVTSRCADGILSGVTAQHLRSIKLLTEKDCSCGGSPESGT